MTYSLISPSLAPNCIFLFCIYICFRVRGFKCADKVYVSDTIWWCLDGVSCKWHSFCCGSYLVIVELFCNFDETSCGHTFLLCTLPRCKYIFSHLVREIYPHSQLPVVICSSWWSNWHTVQGVLILHKIKCNTFRKICQHCNILAVNYTDPFLHILCFFHQSCTL